METIYQFLHEWALLGLLLCVIVLAIFGIRQVRSRKSELKDEDFPVSDEPEDDTSDEKAEEVFAEEVIKVEEPALMPSRRFYEKKLAYSQTDVVLREFPDLLPKSEEQLEIFRKEWKTLGGKAQMTSTERVRYAAIGHILTVFEPRKS